MNNMIVGSIRTTVNPPLTSGIYEALLEKAEQECNNLQDQRDFAMSEMERLKRERDEALEALQQLQQPPQISAILAGKMAGNTRSEQFSKLERERDEARKENKEQARLLGMGGEREARLITERDHYRQAIEEISVTIQDWLDSIVQEPSLDFIKAIKAWADKKLNNG